MVYDEPQNLFANQFEQYGYTFAGWTTIEDWTGPAAYDYADEDQLKEEDVPTDDGGKLHLYAQWRSAATFIEFDENAEDDKITGEMAQQKTFYDSTTTLSPCEFERDYWDFTGWNTEPDGSGISYPDGAEFISDNPVDDSTLTLYAQWKATEYTIDYDLAGGTVLVDSDKSDDGEVKGNPTTYNINTETFTLINPQRVGYEFLGWTGTGIKGDPQSKVTVKKNSHGNRTYKANWKAEKKTLKFDPNGGKWEDGSKDTATKKADYDSAVIIPDAPSREHYTFEFWEDKSGNKYNPAHEYKVRDDQEFKAIWEPVEYVIDYDLAGGTVEEDANPIAYTVETDDFTLAAPERVGYEFLGWTGSNGDDPEKEVTIGKGSCGDRQYKAIWEPVEYVIDYDLAGGTVEEDANPIAYTVETDDFTLAAPERVGYEFLGWTGSNGDDPEKEVTIGKGSCGDRQYKANWEPVKTAPSEEGENGTGTPTGDDFDPVLWGILLLASAAVAAGLIVRRRRIR